MSYRECSTTDFLPQVRSLTRFISLFHAKGCSKARRNDSGVPEQAQALRSQYWTLQYRIIPLSGNSVMPVSYADLACWSSLQECLVRSTLRVNLRKGVQRLALGLTAMPLLCAGLQPQDGSSRAAHQSYAE